LAFRIDAILSREPPKKEEKKQKKNNKDIIYKAPNFTVGFEG